MYAKKLNSEAIDFTPAQLWRLASEMNSESEEGGGEEGGKVGGQRPLWPFAEPTAQAVFPPIKSSLLNLNFPIK